MDHVGVNRLTFTVSLWFIKRVGGIDRRRASPGCAVPVSSDERWPSRRRAQCCARYRDPRQRAAARYLPGVTVPAHGQRHRQIGHHLGRIVRRQPVCAVRPTPSTGADPARSPGRCRSGMRCVLVVEQRGGVPLRMLDRQTLLLQVGLRGPNGNSERLRR